MPISENLTFPVGTTADDPQPFSITILDDSMLEDTEVIVINVETSSGAMFIGDCAVNILDNDLSFTTNTPTVDGQNILSIFNTIPELVSASCSNNRDPSLDGDCTYDDNDPCPAYYWHILQSQVHYTESELIDCSSMSIIVIIFCHHLHRYWRNL